MARLKRLQMRNGIGGDHEGNQSPVVGRQVLAIKNIDYFLLQFNDKGRIEKGARNERGN
jgi:hypothetical protein